MMNDFNSKHSMLELRFTPLTPVNWTEILTMTQYLVYFPKELMFMKTQTGRELLNQLI